MRNSCLASDYYNLNINIAVSFQRINAQPLNSLKKGRIEVPGFEPGSRSPIKTFLIFGNVIHI